MAFRVVVTPPPPITSPARPSITQNLLVLSPRSIPIMRDCILRIDSRFGLWPAVFVFKLASCHRRFERRPSPGYFMPRQAALSSHLWREHTLPFMKSPGLLSDPEMAEQSNGAPQACYKKRPFRGRAPYYLVLRRPSCALPGNKSCDGLRGAP